MAEKEKKTPQSKPKATTKKPQTVRERAAVGAKTPKRRIRKSVSKATTPVKSIKKLHKKEYHLPIPDTKAGRILKKRVRFFPKFVIEAFHEVRLVTWPTRRETIKLTFAVFTFAIFLASFVGLLDYGLSKAFEEFIVNRK